jgi:hypothetical protein
VPLRGRVTTSPLTLSSPIAAAIVAGLTPSAPANALTLGNAIPGSIVPLSIPRSTEAAIPLAVLPLMGYCIATVMMIVL